MGTKSVLAERVFFAVAASAIAMSIGKSFSERKGTVGKAAASPVTTLEVSAPVAATYKAAPAVPSDQAQTFKLIIALMFLMTVSALTLLTLMGVEMSQEAKLVAAVNGLEFAIMAPLSGWLGFMVLLASKTWVNKRDETGRRYTSVNASSKLFFLTKTKWFITTAVLLAALVTLVVDLTPLLRP